jgi:hypothetical protein
MKNERIKKEQRITEEQQNNNRRERTKETSVRKRLSSILNHMNT